MAMPHKCPSNRDYPIAQPFMAIRLVGCASVLLSCLAGCGGKAASVNGVVQLDGKPLAAASVMFNPIDDGPLAEVVTDVEGHYQVRIDCQSNATAWNYSVTVVKDRVLSYGQPNGVTGMMSKPTIEHLVPVKYGKRATSPLRVTVTPGDQNLDFALTSTQ
jgi:hypothetical protein